MDLTTGLLDTGRLPGDEPEPTVAPVTPGPSVSGELTDAEADELDDWTRWAIELADRLRDDSDLDERAEREDLARCLASTHSHADSAAIAGGDPADHERCRPGPCGLDRVRGPGAVGRRMGRTP